MGNCCERCFGRLDKRRYLRTRYNVERDFSIEFENLMDEESQQEEVTKYGSIVTARERQLLKERQYQELLVEQRKLDTQIDAKLVHQEEELRMEEEAYYEAKREAARVAKAQRQKELNCKSNAAVIRNGPKAWVGDDESDWEVAGGEDDFEMFLESVKARSLAARNRALPSQVTVDAQSTTASDRSRTEASSIDLEWEHEAGMQPLPKEKRRHYPVEDNLAELAVKPMLLQETKPNNSDNNWNHERPDNADSVDFDWEQDEADFNSNDDKLESRTLLEKDHRTISEPDR